MKKKVFWITVAMSIVLLVVGVLLMKEAFAQSVMNFAGGEDITIEDGVAMPDVTEREFVITKAGEYRFDVELKTSEYGPLAGYIITDKDNQQIYYFNANTTALQSEILELDEGEYRITLYHIASYEQYKRFSELVGRKVDKKWEIWQSDVLDNGSFTTMYHLKIQGENYGNLMYGAYALIIIALLALCIAVKGNEEKGIYDERQILVRGRGFKYGFFVILVSNVICGSLGLKGINMTIDSSIMFVLNCLLGTLVYGIYCIWNDGYFALNTRIEKAIGWDIFLGIVCFANSIPEFVRGNVRESHIVYLFTGILTLMLGVVLLLKKYYKDRGEE